MPPCGKIRYATAEELAREFCRCLQAQPALVGYGVHHDWIKAHYLLFCALLNVLLPPPYKDFAHKLKDVMPRRRKDIRSNGERETFVMYEVLPLPTPTAIVFELKRAWHVRLSPSMPRAATRG